MEIYFYCIEESFKKLTSLIKNINKNSDTYLKFKKDIVLYAGNTTHWIVVTYDNFIKDSKINLTIEEKKLFSALKAVDNNQKHELNCIDFGEVGIVGIKCPVNFNEFTFIPKGIVWKNILLDENGDFGSQNKKYNDVLRGKPVWNKLDEAIKIIYKYLCEK